MGFRGLVFRSWGSGFRVYDLVQVPVMQDSDVWESMFGPQVLFGFNVQGSG